MLARLNPHARFVTAHVPMTFRPTSIHLPAATRIPRHLSSQRALRASFQPRPPLHAVPKRSFLSVPTYSNREYSLSYIKEHCKRVSLSLQPRHIKHIESLDAQKLVHLSDIWNVLVNKNLADRSTFVLLLNKISGPQAMHASDIHGLTSAVNILGENKFLTRQNLVSLLENSDKCFYIGATTVYLHNNELLNQHSFNLLVDNAADLFYNFDMVFKMLPYELITLSNLERVMAHSGKSQDMAMIHMQMNERGIVNQKNMNILYLYALHSANIRLMMEHLPEKCDAQAMFEKIIDKILLIDSILIHAVNGNASKDKVKIIIDLIFDHMDHLSALEYEIRKQVIYNNIMHDLVDHLRHPKAPVPVSQSQHSLFAPVRKNDTIRKVLAEAAAESRPVVKPKF